MPRAAHNNAFARPQRQRGMTVWSWLYVLGTLGLILLVGIKSLPVYMNNYDIRGALEWAAAQPELHSAPAVQIQRRIQKRFDTGYVDNIHGRDIKVKRTKEGRRISVDYEVRRPLFFNIVLLFDFHESALIRKNKDN